MQVVFGKNGNERMQMKRDVRPFDEIFQSRRDRTWVHFGYAPKRSAIARALSAMSLDRTKWNCTLNR
jgi:hypothetical protein